jgi:transposase
MEAVVECCAGLDVHQGSVVACVLLGAAGRKPRKEVRTFATATADLVALRDWLKDLGVTHVGMESTGVYWKPVYAVLEGHFELIVRDLVRLRRSLSEGLTTERNRTLKLLETANVKLASVASEVFGVSGMAMLRALVENAATPEQMADLARGKLRRKLTPLARALEGRLTEHHRFVLDLHLRRMAAIEADLAALDARIEAQMEPFRAQRALLRQIPGVDDRVAATIIAEIGIDMSVFGSAMRLASWAGVCPGNHESAGRQRRGTTRRGNVHLKTALVTAAIGASRRKGSYYKDKYHRLKARRGYLRAAVAIAHKILVAAYHMLATGAPFRDLGEAYLDQQARRRTTTNLVRRLNGLGYDVMLQPRAAGP